jgi:hypothetical protein
MVRGHHFQQLLYVHCDFPNAPYYHIAVSLTECNTGTTQRVTFVVNTTKKLKNITISDNTGTLVSGYIARWMGAVVVGCNCYIF